MKKKPFQWVNKKNKFVNGTQWETENKPLIKMQNDIVWNCARVFRLIRRRLVCFVTIKALVCFVFSPVVCFVL